jgi:hypothetical protein
MKRLRSLSWCLVLLGTAASATEGESLCRGALATVLKTHGVEAMAAVEANCLPLAQQGSPLGLFAQGRLMAAGLLAGGTEQGVALVRRAAEGGLVDAQARLGRMYLHGEEVARDPVEAFTWFSKAAQAGDPVAQYELGQRYYLGQGTAQDHVEAYKWFGLAAESNQAAGDVARSKLARRKQENAREQISWGQRRGADSWIKERLKSAP